MKYQAPRGTHDILPKDTEKSEKIINVIKKYLDIHFYKQIITPIFEHTELFQRSVGESTDIVNKEMYTFLDRSERSLTLRPEATAGVVRAYIENSLHRLPKPIRLWTFGPMFRYERAQTGRYRQFHQINAEILGSDSISVEVESMFMLVNIFNELGLDYKIDINTLGDEESKNNYKEYFKKYTEKFLNDICEDCKRRHEQNPLRMLDCKVEEDRQIYTNAKKPFEFLSENSLTRWEEIKKIISNIKEINFNPNLVRGLDYYNDFVFEVISTNEILKGQSSICGGGRYDKLVENLGGPATPGFGFGFGFERIILASSDLNKKSNLYVSIISSNDEIFQLISFLSKKAFELNKKISFELNFNPKNISKVTEAAIKKNMDFIVYYLDLEKEKNIVKIKNLKTRNETECRLNIDEILECLC